ncbi:hypothetical protein CC80DRAFT_588238 [Byssothecium circinans]|uniref:Uncharacterized protein n=1 Tax=Byssothecium circinans TaxID=147558 RepID=A0A6A5UNR6_9PLEO|nr:hypothetical protein CC80DRAFT_588238 [Byssothecium circinans]
MADIQAWTPTLSGLGVALSGIMAWQVFRPSGLDEEAEKRLAKQSQAKYDLYRHRQIEEEKYARGIKDATFYALEVADDVCARPGIGDLIVTAEPPPARNAPPKTYPVINRYLAFLSGLLAGLYNHLSFLFGFASRPADFTFSFIADVMLSTFLAATGVILFLGPVMLKFQSKKQAKAENADLRSLFDAIVPLVGVLQDHIFNMQNSLKNDCEFSHRFSGQRHAFLEKSVWELQERLTAALTNAPNAEQVLSLQVSLDAFEEKFKAFQEDQLPILIADDAHMTDRIEKNEKAFREEFDQVKNSNHELESEMGQFKDAQADMEREMVIVKSFNTNIEHELATVKKTNSDLQCDLDALKTFSVTMHCEMDNVKNANADLRSEIAGIKEAHTETQRNMDDMKRAIDVLRKDEESTLVKQLQDELSILKQDFMGKEQVQAAIDLAKEQIYNENRYTRAVVDQKVETLRKAIASPPAIEQIAYLKDQLSMPAVEDTAAANTMGKNPSKATTSTDTKVSDDILKKRKDLVALLRSYHTYNSALNTAFGNEIGQLADDDVEGALMAYVKIDRSALCSLQLEMSQIPGRRVNLGPQKVALQPMSIRSFGPGQMGGTPTASANLKPSGTNQQVTHPTTALAGMNPQKGRGSIGAGAVNPYVGRGNSSPGGPNQQMGRGNVNTLGPNQQTGGRNITPEGKSPPTYLWGTIPRKD